jgi:hypothetical protein
METPAARDPEAVGVNVAVIVQDIPTPTPDAQVLV